MIENPKTLSITQKIYEKAKIEREFVIAPNKLFFHVINDPAVLYQQFGKIEFIVADQMFDSSFLESELTAYLMASDPELAEWNRKHHLSYLEDEMKYFITIEEFNDGINSVLIRHLHKSSNKNSTMTIKVINESSKIISTREIPKAHFDILAKYLTVV